MKKDFKIWGIGYGLIGDLVASLPILTYFERKYPDSYKIFVVEKKCSQAVELFINHPLIDKIKVTDNWNGVGDIDRKMASGCDVRDAAWSNVNAPRRGPWNGQWHNPTRWYNEYTFVEETARIYGIDDMKEVLTEEEMRPQLYKWFDIGFDKSKKMGGYSSNVKTYKENERIPRNIAIWPFAGYGDTFGRSPGIEWWKQTIRVLTEKGYTVHHFGLDENILSNSELYVKYTYMSFFEQVKLSLASSLVIGCESGPMWIMGGYQHPAVHLLTNYLDGHNENLLALNPVNVNSETFYNKSSCDAISYSDVVDSVIRRVV